MAYFTVLKRMKIRSLVMSSLGSVVDSDYKQVSMLIMGSSATIKATANQFSNEVGRLNLAGDIFLGARVYCTLWVIAADR